jgi:two-component system cell cycle sensor histidine kinase/response regulator CckA
LTIAPSFATLFVAVLSIFWDIATIWKSPREAFSLLEQAMSEKQTRSHQSLLSAMKPIPKPHQGIHSALGEDEGLFRDLFENDRAVKLLIDPHTGHIVDANKAAENFYGWSREKLRQMSIQEINILSAEIVHEEMEKVARQERNHFEFRHRTADGSVRDVDVFSSRITTKGRDLLYSVIQDVTERKRAEEALTYERNLLQALLDNTPDHVYFKDKDSHFLRISKSLADKFGLSDPAQAIGKTDFHFFSEEHALRTCQDEQHIMLTSMPLVGFEEKETWPDGRQTWASTTKMPLHDRDGQILGTFGISRDITERKRAEIQLRSSEEKFSKLFQSSPDAVVLTEIVGGKIIEVNDSFEKFSGYSRGELLGHPVLDFNMYSSADRQKFVSMLQEQRRIHEVEFNLTNKEGRTLVVMASAELIEIDEVPCALTILHEITARKRGEEALRESEERFRLILENMPILLNAFDEKGNFIAWNKACETATGYGAGEIIGNARALELLYPDPEYREMVWNSSVDPKHKNNTFDLVTKDGEVRTVEWFDIYHHLTIPGWASWGMGQDVTDRKKAEEKIRLLAQALASTKDCVSLTDLDDKIIFVNDAFLQTYRYTQEELVGKPISLARSATISEELGSKILAGTFAGGWYGEILNRRKDGTEFPVELWTSVVKDESGNIVATVGVARDITERKRAEEALRQAQKSESIGTLAGGIAHDFNNLLNAMLGQSTLAIGKLPKESPARNHIGKAINAAERAADLTRQLLAYSGKGRFVTEEFDLNRLVEENAQLLEVSVPKTTQLRYALDSSTLCLNGDVGQIQQVIMNLIINAGEAMGPNPGYITVRTSLVALTQDDIEYWRYTNTPLAPGKYALLQVSDTGNGMRAEVLARIFDPFFTTKFTGRGLGLAAVLGIIRGHQGGVRITSEEGKGTQFDLVFPIVGAAVAMDGKKANWESVKSGEGKTVLVIDDEAFVLELLTDVFAEVNYTVIGALNPMEGIELYHQHRDEIAVVILDYSMPGMGGKEAFDELIKINKDVKVLLCSGYSEEETTSAFGEIRPAAFIHKPCQPAELLERMSRVLSEHKTTDRQ